MAPDGWAWGLSTHRWVNEAAIDVAPEGLRPWLREHRDVISDQAVEPDTVLREKHGRREAVRHFINLDLYGAPPFGELPRDRGDAERRFGRRRVAERGILPWTILEMHEELVRQMRRGRWRPAMRAAGRAGHYVSDAFMPLHATVNHDGQQTGNDGLHHRLERGLVNRRLKQYARKAEAVPREADCRIDAEGVFAVLLRSHALVPELLRADRRARAAGRVGSPRYFDVLDREAGTLLSRRLGESRAFLACFWRSAWRAAGKPSPPGTSP